ncbi:MAG TPA: DUF2855 family protein, partial [Xanthomonadales bacterium]|nr:DUF2855 family protein [Xanthomonadales bacterium]
VIVDMSGNGALLARLHRRLGDNMRYCSNVGITHYESAGMEPGFIAERSAMFFAPSHIQKRGKDWGPGVFQQKVFEFWQRAARQSREWLRLEAYEGLDGMESAYRQIHAGEIEPSKGIIVSL